MSDKRAKKAAIRQLQRLLRGLSRPGALLLFDARGSGSRPQYRICIVEEGGKSGFLQAQAGIVEYCLREDLLSKTPEGWIIGPNGRLALKRMMAGTEPFAEQHQTRNIRQRTIGGEKQSVVVNDRSSPLGWLSRRTDRDGKPMITSTQFAAGERLARDFQFAGMMPRITASWSGPGIGGQRRSAPGAGLEISDNALAAKQRVRTAVMELGDDLADILLDICCFQLGLGEVEKKRHWPRRSGKVILLIALDRLANHYGMKVKGRPEQGRASQISHWGAEGYRPR